ncbi:hypothetical protein NBRC116590_27420 [Pelagimonas sp. KU-00592-HH]|uniref:hypothetical protein n=1 Tax=Pelagimonas sp. KU-00592-HH TaxID=3127651 RepID=UPI003102989E
MTFSEFIKRSSPTDWIQTIFGLPAFVVAVYALYQSGTANDEVDKATQKAGEAVREAEKAIDLADKIGLDAPATNQLPEDSDLLVLQMASYRLPNCSTAQAEADGYGNEFGAKPTLWLSPGAKYVVVGIQAQTNEQAIELRDKARELSKLDQFSNEDLENARIRVNPDWTPIAGCSSLK